MRLYIPLSHLSARLRRVELVMRVSVHVRHRLDDLQQTVAFAHAVQLGSGMLASSGSVAGRGRLLAVRGVVDGKECVRVGLCGAAQVLRGRIADRDLDLLVLVVARAELVIAVWRDARAVGVGCGRGRGTNGGRVAVRAAVTVRRLVEVCAAAPVNAQRQSLLFKSISDSLGTCSIVD